MKAPTVQCNNCGQLLDERTDTPISERKPCPNCGSLSRRMNVSAEDRLSAIDDAYAKTARESDERIRALQDELPAIADVQEVVTRLRQQQTESAMRALIETVRVGQGESAKTAEKLNGLTVELVRWTRILTIIGIIAAVAAVAALLRSPA